MHETERPPGLPRQELPASRLCRDPRWPGSPAREVGGAGLVDGEGNLMHVLVICRSAHPLASGRTLGAQGCDWFDAVLRRVTAGSQS